MKIDYYEAYVETEISWLQRIPQHWNISRIKCLTQTKSGTTPKSGSEEYYENGKYFWVRTADLNDGKLYSSEFKVTDLALKHYNLIFIQPGSILLAMYGGMGTIGKNSLLGIEATINQSVCSIFPNPKRFDSQYLWYYIKFFKPNWERFADSARKDPNINQEAIKRLWVLLPPLSEQKSIAHYLDTKTAQIDRKIDLLTQKAKRYEELKRAIVNETVTGRRRIDNGELIIDNGGSEIDNGELIMENDGGENCQLSTVNYPLYKAVNYPLYKDSAIEWLGEIPKHWELKRHKDNFHLITKRCEDRNLIKVGLENIESQTGRFLETESEFDGDGIEFKPNDILFGKLRPYLAKVYLSEFRGSAVGDIFVYRPRSNLDPNFSRHTMLSHRYIDIINSSTIGAKMPRVSSNFISNLPFAIPPLPEQKAIAHYLDTKTAHIDLIIQTINTQIEKLKELRKTLINDVVTGKIKVIDNG